MIYLFFFYDFNEIEAYASDRPNLQVKKNRLFRGQENNFFLRLPLEPELRQGAQYRKMGLKKRFFRAKMSNLTGLLQNTHQTYFFFSEMYKYFVKFLQE